ncbi:MAG: hypothetical protein K8T89_15275 [Planctomycetes bacterium]|nr:hypothetical protein [Planctomycetota bacterium]
MLVGGPYFAQRRVTYLLCVTAGFLLPALVWYVAARFGWLQWPSGSGPVGYGCGVVAGLIVLFEMALWVRKKLRRKHWLGSTRTWMALHIWLGLVSLPLAICHSGFAFGGPLSMAVLLLFLAVIASGVWGLIMQQVIPRKLIDEIPGETIVTETEHLMKGYLAEAEALILSVRRQEVAIEHGAVTSSVVVRSTTKGYRVEQLDNLFKQRISPYLLTGKRGGGPLAHRARSVQMFAELRREAEPEFAEVVSKLEAICEKRRSLDDQARLYFWLHNWLCIHLPLSFALVILLVAHVVVALKYW